MKKITVEQAREVITDAFEADDGFRDTYVANIACVIMDNTPGFIRNAEKRNKLADQILTHILS